MYWQFPFNVQNSFDALFVFINLSLYVTCTAGIMCCVVQFNFLYLSYMLPNLTTSTSTAAIFYIIILYMNTSVCCVNARIQQLFWHTSNFFLIRINITKIYFSYLCMHSDYLRQRWRLFPQHTISLFIDSNSKHFNTETTEYNHCSIQSSCLY